MMSERLLNALLLAALASTALWAWASGETFVVTLATRAAILALAAVGLNLALGLGGLVSLGHAAFFGLGGYAMVALAVPAQDYAPLATWPVEIAGTNSMPLIWLVAMTVSGLAALGIGALSLRTSGVYFIMVTLAFAQMLFYVAVSWPRYGGADGQPIYLRNGFPGLDTLDPLVFFGLSFAALCAGLALWRVIAGSAFGLALDTARQSPDRAETAGFAPYGLRLTAFTLSGAITGLAGALYGDLNRFVSPAMLSWQTSGEILVFVILGGVGRLCGPLAGAGLFVLLEHLLGGISDYWQIALGGLLLGVVLFAPGGVVGLLARRPAAHG